MNRNNNSAPNHVLPKPDMISGVQLVWDLLNETTDGLTNPVDYIEFNTGYTYTGTNEYTMFADTANETLSVTLPDGITGQMFEEDFVQIENKTGAELSNGKVISFAGTVGNSGLMCGQYALSTSSFTSIMVLGISTQNIENNGSGKITSRGKVRGIPCNGAMYGETWNKNDILYLSTGYTGGLTNVMPQAPYPAIPMAVVISNHATNGTLYVRPTYPARLSELVDVDGTPLTASGQILVWDNTRKVHDFTNNINNYSTTSHTHTAFNTLYVTGLTYVNSTGTTTYNNTYNMPVTTALTGGTILQNNLPLLHTYGTNNLFIGGAGNYTLTGGYNVGQGSSVMGKLTTGTNNFGIGFESMLNATTASYNFAFGYRALYTLTTGAYNTAIGRYALRYTTSGRFNLGVGEQALFSNTTGYYNIGIGQSSLNANETGYANIGLGYASGLYYKGTNSVFIGYWSGAHVSSGDNQLHIGISGNTLIEGNFATGYVQINNNLKVSNSLSASTAYFGNVSTGNYTAFEADGTIVRIGSATTFRDELGDALNLKIQGPGLSLNLTEGCIEYAVSSDMDDFAIKNMQINHDWKFGSNLEPHAHGWQSNNNIPNLLCGYRWQRNGQLKTSGWTYIKMNTPVFTYVSGTLDQIWSCGSVCITPPVGYSISDIVQTKIIRDNNNDSGLFTGVDTYTGTLQITSFDTHIEADTDGSRSLYSK